MNDKEKIVSILCTGDFSDQDVRDMQNAFSILRERVVSKKRDSFVVGDKVEFNNSSNGTLISGVVSKVNRVNIGVKSDEGVRWRVSPSLLRKV